jgi:transcriptional regulator with XRE-family HTH domain
MTKIIGKIIQEKLKASTITVVEFASLINVERSNVYHIFKRSSIDTEMLKKIGHILNYDFFQHFLEPETIQKLQINGALKKSKVLIELELNDDEIMKIGFQEKLVQILNR